MVAALTRGQRAAPIAGGGLGRTVEGMKKSRPVTFGRPGAYASHLVRQANLHAAAFGIGTGCALIVAALNLVATLRGELVGAMVVAVGLAFAALGRHQYSHWVIKARKAAVGARAERVVATALAGTGAAAVVHGALLGAGGDADHIVLGPWVVLVETKHGRGPVSVVGERLVVGGRKLPGDPVGQARRQAGALSHITGRTASAVVCVPGMEGPQFRHRGVTVCSAPDLAGAIACLPPILDGPAALEWARRLHTAPIPTPGVSSGRRAASAA